LKRWGSGSHLFRPVGIVIFIEQLSGSTKFGQKPGNGRVAVLILTGGSIDKSCLKKSVPEFKR
jgi:hypothetical protein